MSKRLLFVSLCIGFIFLLCDVSAVFAQESETDEFTLEEITVTAQKREENQQKVPIQMEVISGETLAESGMDNVDEILKNVSNAMINMSPDGMRVTVRGIAEEDSVWHDMRVSTPTVAINIDGAYNSGKSAGMNMFDIERVEVLSGPQSTLYGSNSPGGIVNVVTAAPKTDRYSASASAEIGSYSLRNYQATFNAPIFRDSIAMRLAAQQSERGSWVDGGDTAQDTTTARLKTLFKPNDKISATLTLNWAKRGSGGMMGGNVALFDYQDGHYYDDGTKVENPWTAKESAGMGPAPAAFTGGGLVASQEPPPDGGGGGGGGAMGQDQITKGISAEISWETGFGTLSVVPSYSKAEAEDTSEYETNDGNETVRTSINHTIQKNAEVRIASPMDAPFSWIVGGTYYKSDRENSTDDWYYDSNDSLQNTKQENKGVYGNLTYPFTDKFRGNAGYRRSWDKASNVETPAKVGNGISGQEYSNPDYKIGLEYDLADNAMLYVSYATSYRVNGMAISQATDEGDRSVPPEEMRSYTVGAKSRFFGNKLQVNSSVYYYDYTNKSFAVSEQGRFSGETPLEEEYPYTDADGVYHTYTDLDNNGELTDEALTGQDVSDPWIQQFGGFRSIGADISTSWIISSKDRLDLSVSYLNAKWTDMKIHFYWYWIWEDEGRDFSGMKNTFSPTLSATASYEHNFTLWTWGALVPHIDVQFKTGYDLSYTQDMYPYNYQESYYIVNGNVTYTHSSGKWTLNGYVKNATNYAVKTFWQNVSGSYSLGLNDPRTYGGNFTIRF